MLTLVLSNKQRGNVQRDERLLIVSSPAGISMVKDIIGKVFTAHVQHGLVHN